MPASFLRVASRFGNEQCLFGQWPPGSGRARLKTVAGSESGPCRISDDRLAQHLDAAGDPVAWAGPGRLQSRHLTASGVRCWPSRSCSSGACARRPTGSVSRAAMCGSHRRAEGFASSVVHTARDPRAAVEPQGRRAWPASPVRGGGPGLACLERFGRGDLDGDADHRVFRHVEGLLKQERGRCGDQPGVADSGGHADDATDKPITVSLELHPRQPPPCPSSVAPDPTARGRASQFIPCTGSARSSEKRKYRSRPGPTRRTRSCCRSCSCEKVSSCWARRSTSML